MHKTYIGLIAFSLLGTLFSTATKMNPGFIAPLCGVLTLGIGVWCLMEPLAAEFGSSRVWGKVLPVLGIGCFAEFLGVYTGLPFGRYAYTTAWWPTVLLPGGHWFPLLLPFAWLMMAVGGYLLFSQHFSGMIAIGLGAFLVVLIDLPMEWVMVEHLGYWKWTDGSWPIGTVMPGVPLMNSVGWFITAAIAGIMLQRAEVHRATGYFAAKLVLAGHFVLVIGIGLIHSLYSR